MTPVPTPIELPQSVSRSDERIRRLELRVAGTPEQPDALVPPPLIEPDPFVQWIQRGGGATTGAAFSPVTGPGMGWSIAYGPLARHLWEQESSGAGSEAFNRQIRVLRQRLRLLPTPERIRELGLDDDHHMLSGGAMTIRTGSFGWWGKWFYNTTTGKVTPLDVPGGYADETWVWASEFDSPACGTCFGLPCELGAGCGDIEVHVDFTTAFSPYADGAWVWTTTEGAEWVHAGEARGIFCKDADGTPHWGYSLATSCVGAPCEDFCFCGGFDGTEVSTTYTCHQATCNFAWWYQFHAPLRCRDCASEDERRYLNGGDQVNYIGGFHTNAHQTDAFFCGGVVSNQHGSPPAAIFVIPDSVQRGDHGPIVDATPVDRSVVGSWSYGFDNTEALNKDAWGFYEWSYGGEITGDGIYRGDGLVDESDQSVIPQEWFDLRNRLYTEMATGRYQAVCDFYAAQSAGFAPVEDDWREVPLCGNWEGRLAFRRVGGIVEWKGTITNKQPIVGDQIYVASWLPQEAMGPTSFENIYQHTWASTPTGPLLLTISPEAVDDDETFIGPTGSIRVTAAAALPTYRTGGPIDTSASLTGLPAWQHPRVQTNPDGDHEEITFDGVSYYGADLPSDFGWSLPWITTTPESPELDCGDTAYDLPEGSAFDVPEWYDFETGDTIVVEEES